MASPWTMKIIKKMKLIDFQNINLRFFIAHYFYSEVF